jgi:hypothetical protein
MRRFPLRQPRRCCAPGELTLISFSGAEITQRATLARARSAIEQSKDFQAVVVYADVGGEVRGAVRLDIGYRSGVWFVRQNSWAETVDRLETDAALSSKRL